MKIQLTHYGKTYTAEGPDDGDIVSVLEDFKGLLVACGFHPRTVDSHFPHMCSAWWTDEEELVNDDDPEGSTRDQLTSMNWPQDFDNKHDDSGPTKEYHEPTNY